MKVTAPKEAQLEGVATGTEIGSSPSAQLEDVLKKQEAAATVTTGGEDQMSPEMKRILAKTRSEAQTSYGSGISM